MSHEHREAWDGLPEDHEDDGVGAEDEDDREDGIDRDDEDGHDSPWPGPSSERSGAGG
ncbi:hypothetical protein [Streptomyces wuyuanensis]|uniref:hypothetical protein n=1 Tax=Streptomyces wuyuanensis TaxID=1196353 RepID=UPI0014309043|nr:hypothetical protein [Streptomyces wuyuanensis]